MSDDDATNRKLQMKVPKPSSAGYLVKKSEETMRNLEKENFNLKLKIYILENKQEYNKNLPTEISSDGNKEYFDLLLENESLKTELNEKKEIMLNALKVIELIEHQKDEQKKQSEAVINEHLKRIDALQVIFERMMVF